MNRFFLKIFLILIILTAPQVLSAQLSGKVYWNNNPSLNYVNLGPCFIKDSLKTKFIAENNGSDSLQILPVAPTFIIYANSLELTPDQFREFEGPTNVTLPLTLNQNIKKREIEIGYFPGDTSAFPSGRKIANFKLGLLEHNTLNLVESDSFLIAVQKTPYYIWGFETEIDFDSVYVLPTTAKSEIWKVKSTWKDNITIEEQDLEYLSPITSQDEFTFSNFSTKPEFTSKYQVIDWNISYFPLNTGADSAILRLNYYPEKSSYPDSIDYAWVKMKGVGVQHDLRIVNANVDFRTDTIFLGDIKLNSTHLINLEIENNGNLPFGALNQAVFKEHNKSIDSNFKIIKALAENSNLDIENNQDLIIEYSPDETGIKLARYIVKSDLENREIYGVPSSENEVVFYIKANVVAPEISLPNDTIYFGNVIVNSIDCPSFADTVFTVKNIGNEILRINDIKFIPENNFSISDRFVEILPNSSFNFKIFFSASGNDVKEYSADMQIIYMNGEKPDTVHITLIANGVPPISGILSIPNINSQPGRIIAIPILLKDAEEIFSPISYATSFETRLTFDYTLLRYRNRTSIGSASEGSVIEILNPNYGELIINIDNGNDYFNPNDTIIKLFFDTYLGESISTPIAFSESETFLSNDNCKKAVRVEGNINSGIFSLDSVCGLEYKAVPRKSGLLKVHDIFPNPVNNYFELEFNLPFKSDINITIINSFGIKIDEFNEKQMPAGNYVVKFNSDSFNSGYYNLIFQAGLFIENKPIVIAR